MDIGLGYSASSSSIYPGIRFTGRVPTDPLGTMETEANILTGTGAQVGSDAYRWGDYTAMQVDPSDDCTFWYVDQYQQINGTFDWDTNISSFIFSGCGVQNPNFSLSANPGSVTVAQGNSVTSTITVNDEDGFSGSVQLSASGLPSGVTAQFVPNPTTTTSTLTLSASGSAATGTVTVTVSGVSGTLNNSTTLSLTVNPVVTGVAVSPTALSFSTTVVGATSKAKTTTLTNSSSATLDISSITTSGDFAQSTSTKPCGATLAAGKSCVIDVTFTPTQTGSRTGTLSVNDNASNSPQTVTLSGTGEAQAALTPATATFTATVVGKSSTAKVFTLKNNQSVILKNLVISTTGPFSVSSTTCQTQLTSNASCTIDVKFTPTGVGVETGTVQVSDSANNSPQVSNLTGTGKN